MRYLMFDDFFQVLGNKDRVKILQLLNRRGQQSVSQISTKLAIEQSATSHHLNRLAKCHFVEAQALGKQRLYVIKTATIRPLFELIEKHIQDYCVNGCDHWEVTNKRRAYANN